MLRNTKSSNQKGSEFMQLVNQLETSMSEARRTFALRQSLWNEPDTKAKESGKSINKKQKSIKVFSPAMPGGA